MSEKAPRDKIWRWMRRHRIACGMFVLLLIVGGICLGVSLILSPRTNVSYYTVISQSMYHGDDSWRDYFTDRGCDTSAFPLQGGFERGDLLTIEGVNPLTDVKVGDVIEVSMPGQSIPWLHRVVAITESNGEIYFTTKGDNNPYVLQTENCISPAQVLGKVVSVTPRLVMAIGSR